MMVDIDQSGKLEQLNTATAVAYSDHRSGAIWIRAGTKRRIAARLRNWFPRRSDFWPAVFAMVLFHLMTCLPPDVVIRIDEEYPGKNQFIARKLAALFHRRHPERRRGSIRFGRIGKRSPAHRLAWQVHRAKNRQRVRTMTEGEILAEWG